MSKEKLMHAALHLFAEKGYDGTALSEIAKEAGIKTPSIYAHFESKEALYMAIYREVIQIGMSSFKERNKEDYESLEEYFKAIFYEVTDFETYPEVKKFFQRSVYFPPASLKVNLNQETASYETFSFEVIGTFLNELNMTEKAKERWIHMFYCLIDGLSVEHGLYDLVEFEKRRASAFDTLCLLIAEGGQ
ncbi:MULTISPECIES: TetR/AcrR family transcriptional regulator [Listeria]|uniref:TetR/AcrR family transcriptional regulator n=1 Tax=Listeria TaxID=1637 RepID=UPI000B59828C|nr:MULTISPECIES: TetR/AcrR family transcriptional regulator [Listeria]